MKVHGIYEIGHRVYWLEKAGWRLWELKDSAGRLVRMGSRNECLETLSRLLLEANGMSRRMA